MTRQPIQQPSLLKVYKVELDFFYINVLKTLLQKCLNQPLDSPIDLSQVVKSVMRMAFGRTGFVIKLTKIRMIIGKENIKSFFKSIVVYSFVIQTNGEILLCSEHIVTVVPACVGVFIILQPTLKN